MPSNTFCALVGEAKSMEGTCESITPDDSACDLGCVINHTSTHFGKLSENV